MKHSIYKYGTFFKEKPFFLNILVKQKLSKTKTKMADYEFLHMLSFDDKQSELMQFINTDVEHKVCEIKKQRGKAKIYKEYASFKDCQTADAALKQVFAEHKWRKRHLKVSKEGKKRFYDCNTTGPRAQCPVRLYLLMHPDSCHTTVHISVDQHNHQAKFETDSEMMRLPEFVKKEILNLYENGKCLVF